MAQHEHLPPPGHVQALPTIEHGDRALPEGTASATINEAEYPSVVRALNLIREDNGGPSWPPESEPVIAARWLPWLPQIERAVASLADNAPAPEDVDTCNLIIAGAEFCYLDGALYQFCAGEETVMQAIAARSPDLTIASHFLNDFFEGWTSYEDGTSFDPTKWNDGPRS